MAKKSPLLAVVRHYFETDPAKAVHSLEGIPEEEAIEILKSLPPTLTLQAFPHLPIAYAASLLKSVPDDLFSAIVGKLNPQQGADLFNHFTPQDRERLLAVLPEGVKKEIQELLTYPQDSAGRILSTDFVAFHHDLKVKDVIQKIRLLAQKGQATSYNYVVDPNNRLVGVINMRDLLIASGEQPLVEIMRKDIFTINGFMDRETVANELTQRKYFAVPVVDNENRLLGIVRAEQLLEDVQEEATEDIQKMFGVSGNEKTFSPLSTSLQKRLPWLYVNLGTAFLAASVVALFENIIAKITILAVFMPVVAGQGGNAGAQSLAIAIRGIVLREIPVARAKVFILKQSLVGLLNGILVGLVTALIAWGWHQSPMLGLVIGLAMVVCLFVAGFTGAAIPLTMKKLGFDPAQCSNIILTTFTDCVGFFVFLGLAVLFQSYLL